MSEVEHNARQEFEAAKKLIASIAAYGDDELTFDMIEGETDLFELLEALNAQMDDDQVLLAGIKERKAVLGDRETRIKARVERCRALIEQGLVLIGKKTHELPTATLTLKAVPPKLQIVDESLVPPIYWKKPDPVLDKKQLTTDLRALEEGETIPGVCLTNGGETLQVRNK